MQKKISEITATRHVLPFANLSDKQFESLCFWIVSKSGEFDSVQHYGMSGDRQRDVVGYKHSTGGQREFWYFQCKRYKKIGAASFKKELDALKKHCDKDKSFKPDVIVFVTACVVSPTCKDEVTAYAKGLGNNYLYFWTDVEVDEKSKTTGADGEFFGGGIDRKALAKDVAEELIKLQQPGVSFQSSGQASESNNEGKNIEINAEIDAIVKLMDNAAIDEAKNRLFVLLGNIQVRSSELKNERARIYNNLGVCFNRSVSEGGDLSKAEEYFDLALRDKPDLYKAQVNKASVYLNRGGDDNFRKAYDIARSLWDGMDKKDALIFQTLAWSTFHYQGPKEVLEFYENSSEAQILIKDDWRSLNLMGMVALSQDDYKRAEEFVKSALELAPLVSANLTLMARIFMARSQKEKIIPSVFETVPKFRDYADIESAVNLLEQALGIAKKENNAFLEEQTKYDILICELWLRRANEAKYKNIRESINLSRLDPSQQQQLQVNDFIVELHKRKFEVAYERLCQAVEWKDVSYKEKLRLAHIFCLRGAPQQAKEILKQIEASADQAKDVRFWLDMSIAEILLNNKILAIAAAQKAKEYARNTDKEKMTLSHFNALMLRYVPSGEVDRLMEGMFDYNGRYPEDKIIWSIKAIDDDGKPTSEMKSILLKQKDKYDGLKRTFKTEPVISYFLKEILKRPYADILSSQNDPDFTIELTIPSEDVLIELTKNLDGSQQIVFDYSALLNISKMNLLGHLSKLGKTLFIAEALFDEIQHELLMFENEDLRRLWNYLRNSKEIQIVEQGKGKLVGEKIGELFDDWVLETMKLAKEKNAIIMVDDWRFLLFIKSESLKGCNNFVFLKYMLSKKWIDSKVYATSLGDLAERFYTFLSFSGDDLFQIVMEDEAKVTSRSYHLVNQLFLPGSIAPSFTNVFVRFIDLLWKTGALPEDKLHWLSFLTKTILDFIENLGGVKNQEELKKIAPDFIQMWIIAVKHGGKDEIALMDKKIEELFNKSYLNIFKTNLRGLVVAKKESFKK